jgi:hypothetical protein
VSHVTAVDLEIKDLDCLAEAAEEIGLELMRDQKKWKWYGRWVRDYHADDAAYKNGVDPKDYGKCDHALRVKDRPNDYEAGLYLQPDGTYKMAFDFFGSGIHMKNAVGEKAGKLKQAYAKAVAVKSLKKKGFTPHKIEMTADNKLKVTLRG